MFLFFSHLLGVAHGDACSSDNQCQVIDVNTGCISLTCQCLIGYRYDLSVSDLCIYGMLFHLFLYIGRLVHSLMTMLTKGSF